jgi:alkylhydroperoxidase family enzyme
MAYIEYVPYDEVPAELQVPDDDNIVQIHGIHAEVLRRHYDLYLELMRHRGPLRREHREMLAVRVSAINRCRY